MTNAIVSGQAKTALLIDGDIFLSFDIDAPEILKPRRESDFRFLFGEATDLRFIQNTQQKDVLRELRADYDKTCVLDLALMLLDEDISETKPLIGEVLEELLIEESLIIYLESIFYAKPLPASADTENALRVCKDVFPKTHDWLSTLIGKQDDITWVREVWDKIATDVFGDEEKRADFQKVIIHEGIFRELVLHCRDNSKISSINISARMNKLITSLSNHRDVLQALFTPFGQPRVSTEEKRLLKDEREATVSTRQKGRQRIDGESVKNKVQATINLIKTALTDRNLALAHKLTNELIPFQLKNGKPIHAVKSLCQLAQNTKELGFYKFQLELTERAIGLEYSDAWTQAQYGDALLQNSRFEEALKTYEIAISFSQGKDTETEVVSKRGYAEVLKAQGKFDESLQIYEEVMKSNPEDIMSKTGYAEVLKAQGKFDESLQIYEEIRKSHPEDVVARNGYAEILKAQGRFGEALQIYEEIRKSHPENVVTKTGYAEILKAQGRFGEALQIYQETMKSHPENVVTKTGLCGVLLALGRYEEALEKLPKDSSGDWVSYHMRGMILLRKGDLAEAIKIFEKGEKEDPIPSSREYFRGALAIARLRQGEFKQAGELLDKVTAPLLQPAVNLFRVHAFGEMKMYSQAEAAFLKYKNAPISKTIAGYQRNNTLELVSEMDSRYVTSRIRNKSDDWLINKEEDLLLALAP